MGGNQGLAKFLRPRLVYCARLPRNSWKIQKVSNQWILLRSGRERTRSASSTNHSICYNTQSQEKCKLQGECQFHVSKLPFCASYSNRGHDGTLDFRPDFIFSLRVLKSAREFLTLRRLASIHSATASRHMAAERRSAQPI